MELGKNINKEIQNSIGRFDDSLGTVVANSVSDSTSYNVYKSIRKLVGRLIRTLVRSPVLTSIGPINDKLNYIK